MIRFRPWNPTTSKPLAAGSSVVVVGDAADLVATLRQASLNPIERAWSQEPEAIDAAGLIFVAPPRSPSDLSLQAFRWVRAMSGALRSRADALVASVTSFDGRFGFHELDDAIAGGLAGVVKTVHHEWPGVRCRVIDRSSAVGMGQVWPALIAEGPIEIGVAADGMAALEMKHEAQSPRSSTMTADDVVLITGGARGVTSAVARRIAQKHGSTLILLGRSPLDEPEPDFLVDCSTEASLRQALAKQGGRTPKQIAGECQRVLAAREGRRALTELRGLGSRVVYRAVDVADRAAVTRALDDVRPITGPITRIIHGAGVLADRRVEDLTDEQFQHVYSTKVDGIEAVLSATAHDPIHSITLFSSSTGRFGRTGQVAYAAANEVLNKIAQREQRRRPGAKVVALNWGPWEGGMVTSALRELFAKEGVGLIPLEAGADALLNELAAPNGDAEVVFIAELPPVEPTTAGKQVGAHRADLATWPVLASHVIGGRAVLPLALHLELLADAAMRENPGLAFRGVDDFRLFHGVMPRSGEAVDIVASVDAMRKRAGCFTVPAKLSRGAALHSRADVILGGEHPPESRLASIQIGPIDDANIYETILFHGPMLRGVERLEGVGPDGVIGWCRPAPAPAAWINPPHRRAWIADPLLLDAAFQLMIVWSVATHGEPCLPSFVGSYRQRVKAFPSAPVRIVVSVRPGSSATLRADIDFLDESGSLLAIIRGHESVRDAGLAAAFRNNRLAGESLKP